MHAQKNSVEMICSVGELAALFENSHSIEDFLRTVVKIVASHMKAAVCSIYLLDEENDLLVLSANQGLRLDKVQHVYLQLGEGITGLALKELRAIREGRGSQNPHFKYIPGIEEERCEAFLAVPIVHGLRRVGALVVQDPQPDYFTAEDTKALRAIAAQLATTIENAQLLMSVHEKTEQATSAVKTPSFVRGKPASPGIARGKASVIGQIDEALWISNKQDDETGLADFDRSLEASEHQLTRMQQDMEESLSDVASLIFSAQILMLKDDQFSGRMRRAIENDGVTARQAIGQVSRQYMDLFEKSRNPRLREKVKDIKDLGQRLLRNLTNVGEKQETYEGRIIVAEDLLPSDILKFSAQGVEGVLLIGGGLTVHVAILARSLELPMIIVNKKTALNDVGGKSIIMDAHQGSLFIEPSSEIIERYQVFAQAQQAAEASGPVVKPETFTRDGTRVHLLANINLLSDLRAAKSLNAEGIGLYRSEFPFIVRDGFPSEEEQYRIYRKIVTEMQGRELVFRTLDIGGDKMLSYFPHADEANPFLGLRAIRFSLRHPDIFGQQLRALLRAGHGAEIKIMFPLISSVDEFLDAKEMVQQACRELEQNGIDHNANPGLGVMIELPSAVEVVEDLAREVDLFSIGTNDLVQYMLAVDRTNDAISDLYLYHHPAVIRALRRIANAAHAHGIDISVCGDMASEATMLPFLLGIGIRKFSVNPHTIPRVQQVISKIDLAESQDLAKRVLSMPLITDIAKTLGLQEGKNREEVDNRENSEDASFTSPMHPS